MLHLQEARFDRCTWNIVAQPTALRAVHDELLTATHRDAVTVMVTVTAA